MEPFLEQQVANHIFNKIVNVKLDVRNLQATHHIWYNVLFCTMIWYKMLLEYEYSMHQRKEKTLVIYCVLILVFVSNSFRFTGRKDEKKHSLDGQDKSGTWYHLNWLRKKTNCF